MTASGSGAPGAAAAGGSAAPGAHPGPGGRAAFGEDGGAAGGSVPKVATGIAGFDEMTMGGLPRGRITVVAGQAGSAKTVFAAQFLAEGVRSGQPGVFVTLEEPVADLRANLSTLGHDLAGWEASGDWAFVDASPQVSTEGAGALVQPYYVQTLLAQITHAVDAVAADRLVLDSVTAITALDPDPAVARQLLRMLITALRSLGLTIVMTVETPSDPAQSGTTLSALGVEEFVADTVVLIHNIREGRARRRSLEVLKMRGAAHFKTESAFVVLPGRGVVILPTSRAPRDGPTGDETITIGAPGLDAMLGGGLRRSSLTLVAGPTGAGKTLLASTFAAAAPARGERALLLAYEESHEQVLRNASGWGQGFRGWEREGLLQVSAFYPDAASLDEHLVEIQDLVHRLRPTRLVLDSISALARLGTGESYREFTTRLVAFCKQQQVAALITLSSTGIDGAPSPDDAHVAALADAIVLVRHDLVGGVRRRDLTVLKVRGSAHDEQARGFTITDAGLVLEAAPATT